MPKTITTIRQGGTGADTAPTAINNLLPSQSGQTGKFLKSDGTNVSWDSAGGGGATALTINAQTGTAYTLVLADQSNTLIRMNNAAAITLTVPTNATAAIAIGSVISVEQQGAGIITVTPAGGVTINTTARKSWGQNAVIQLIKVGADVWNVINATV